MPHKFINKENKLMVVELLNLTFKSSTPVTSPCTFNVNMKVIEGHHKSFQQTQDFFFLPNLSISFAYIINTP